MSTVTLPHVTPFSFYPGSPVSPDVPGRWPVALNGVPMMIDDQASGGWSHRGIQQLRAQADQSTSPSEASLNPEGLWRRAQGSWHRGAGQTWRDRAEFDEFRFRSSLGIDVWTPYQMSLLHDTESKYTSLATNLKLVTCGSRLYLADADSLFYTEDIAAETPTWVDVSNYTGGDIVDLCADGYTVYISTGTDIWTTNIDDTIGSSSVNTLDAEVIAFVKGRLMVGNGPALYNITTIGTPPAALFTHFNADFTWVGFAEGSAAIYAAGFSGDKSAVYKIPIKDDGSGLDAPSQAAEIPDGEVVASIGNYLGAVLLGTDRGIRFCEADTSGNLTVGPLIDLDVTVRCFEPQLRFVWFGWSDYDGTHTGLGRMDLTQFTEDIVTGGRAPAYASDLMAADVTGDVLSVVTFEDVRVFAVSGVGVYAAVDVYVQEGSIDSGSITYGLPDSKTSVSIDVRTESLVGGYEVLLAADGGTFTAVGAQSLALSTGAEFPTAYADGEGFEVRLTLTPEIGVFLNTPIILRWTLKVTPGANDGPAEYLMVPFLFHKTVRLSAGNDVPFDVPAALETVKSLRRSRAVVPYQEGPITYSVVVENYEWTPVGLRWDANGSYIVPDGTCLTQLKRIN